LSERPRENAGDQPPTRQREEILEMLRHNLGFESPEAWVDYAIEHSFAKTRATAVPSCPDCGAPPGRTVGQYVYYSTLIHLRECARCFLIWADAHIDPQVLQAHFDRAYKDREYFAAARSWIFQQLARLVLEVSPPQPTVLDVGGAQGDLMNLVRQLHPGARVVVSDLSEAAVRHAREQFGLEGIAGDISSLAQRGESYDVVVLSDVLYYDPAIADVWRALRTLVRPGGHVIIRVPNKIGLIRFRQAIAGLTAGRSGTDRRTGVAHFNPAHSYILTRRYLSHRLMDAGFVEIRELTSPPLVPGRGVLRLAARAYYRAAQALRAASGGSVILTPGMVIVAKRDSTSTSPVHR
jgi:2-polyprenyl-3-methyl-5-hydroxy-6-metoxy-1,4-benzoquinol methylase